jgi:uncharacterized membrane protein
MSNKALFHIRFNHLAEYDHQQWKLLFNNEEYWVKNVVIDGLCSTTKDWMPSDNSYKWHITVYGTCTITKDNVAYIISAQPEYENKQYRHWLKALSYTGIECALSFVLFYSIAPEHQPITGVAGFFYALFRLGSYYGHERFWHKYIKIKK